MNLRKLVSIAAFSACAATPCLAGHYQIDRLEPAFWWQGFRKTELQLLVHGNDIGDLSPSIDYGGVSITRVEHVASPNYLFIYLHIDAATSPGHMTITFSNGAEEISHPFSLLQKNPDPAYTQGFSASDAIYLLTPDRFANGNPDNDNVPGFADAVDRSNLNGRHGGDIQGIADHLDYISTMGFTAIWSNPLLENAVPQSSYHGYSTTDFYRVDPRFGSNDEYKNLVAQARARGIGVIMDMVVNHVGSGHWWMSDLPTKGWINFPDDYVESSHQHETWQDPHASRYDRARFADGWFVPTMPDLNQRNPLLADYLIQNALWWIEYLGLNGIRMDTWPYPDKHFMTAWAQRIMTEYPEFNIVGEEGSQNPAIVSYWQRGKQNHDGYVSFLPSLMDFPLRKTLQEALLADEPAWGSSWGPLYRMLANDFLYPDPASLMIFADNHDMSRIFTQLDEDYDLFRMAITFVLTMRGTPQIFYGTEILLTNRGSDDHGLIRSDFPGGWAGDPGNGFTGDGLSGQQQNAQAFMRKLLNWRKNKTVIHRGSLMHFAPIKSVYIYFRYDDTDTVMVIFNKSTDPVSVDTERFRERLGDASRATDVLTGKRYNIARSITLEPRSVLLLEIQH